MQDTNKEQDSVRRAPERPPTTMSDGLAETPIEIGSGDAPAAEVDVAALEAELAETKDRLLRALAETENVRRRAQREREEASKYAVAGFAKELLSVADNLRRALDSLPEAEAKDERTRSLLAGVEATERELLRVFERHGIRRIDPKRERFNHNFHEAVFEAERPGKPRRDHYRSTAARLRAARPPAAARDGRRRQGRTAARPSRSKSADTAA